MRAQFWKALRTSAAPDEEPGTGSYQAPRQPGPNSGVNEEGVVRLLAGDEAPLLTGPVIRVTITINN